MFISTKANVIIQRSVPDVFDFATDMSQFHKVFTGCGPVAGNERVEMIDGGLPRAGSRRRVYNKDGSVLLEEIHEFTRPDKHCYRIISGLPQPLKSLVSYADAIWEFRALDNGTSITWHYKFKARSPLAIPVTTPIIKVPFRNAMQRCLHNIRDLMENQQAEKVA